MRASISTAIFTITMLVFGARAADVADLSGTWNLNIEKSTWGKKSKPQSATVQVQHQEPKLKYSGTVVVDEQGKTNNFEFDGAIDGKEYPVKGGAGPGKVVIKRVDAASTRSETRSDDGKYVENTVTSLSKDGRVLTRRINLKGPEGQTTWTEVYEKK